MQRMQILIGSPEKKIKKRYYTKCPSFCECNIKKTWDTMKQTKKSIYHSFPKRMIIDGIDVFDQNKITDGFNKFLVEIGPKLASSIPHTWKNCQKFATPSEKFL